MREATNGVLQLHRLISLRTVLQSLTEKILSLNGLHSIHQIGSYLCKRIPRKNAFAGDDGVKKVKVLSGGEKVRCLISKMMICGANVLVFDDPTNHLDMESITALNNGLIKFPGVTLFTSHDHQFIQTTANRIMEIVPSGQLIDKITTYDEYLASDEMARKRQGFAEAASDDED